MRIQIITLMAMTFVAPGARLMAEDSETPVSALAVVAVATDDAAVRASVAKSLPYLEQAGVEWMSVRGCMSCHHVPIMLSTFHAARAKRLTVDTAKLAEWEDWTRKESRLHRNQFRLERDDLNALDAAIMPADVRLKAMGAVDRGYVSEADYAKRLAELLTADELAAHQALLVKTAALPGYHWDRTGGGMDILAQLILGRRSATEDAPSKEFRVELQALMRMSQLADGTWPPGKTLNTLRRWTKPIAEQTTTMWTALALTCETQVQDSLPHVAKIRELLQQQPQQPENYEWLAKRLLFEHRLGTADATAKLREQLCAARNSDGGWGWEKQVPSDAYTTGMALVVLAEVGVGAHPEVIMQTRRYLLTAQQPDGSWLTPAKHISNSTDPKRLKARDEINGYWGTGWAAMGLLATLAEGS